MEVKSIIFGDTASIEDCDFTLKDVQFATEINNSMSSETTLLPDSNAYYKDEAKNGNVFVVITYKIKYNGKTGKRLNASFYLTADDYTVADYNASNKRFSLYVRNQNVEGQMNGNVYASLWNIEQEHDFKALDDELTIREYIEVPISKIEGRELKLFKQIGNGLNRVVYKINKYK